ncbi:MAG: ADP-forming succinate--CoA ligase subunit beta [Pseudomonadota bacterium]|nr:ADP-forming succinate--CoA ligase subunit beta [Pseudomonadota bacterium]
MNIHEHQAKEILKEFGAPITEGIVIFNTENLFEKIKALNSDQLVLKAQIHAGGRGKAGGVKLVKKDDIINEAKNLFGKILVTPQTGPEGREVKRIYVQKAYDISKEFYISCLVDRQSSKIAFISSTEGGVDIEAVAQKNPEKIITTKVDFKKNLGLDDLKNILKIFKLDKRQMESATKLVNAMYEAMISKDASLIEINPLVVTKNSEILCLDAKMNFDDNAIFKHPEIFQLRDLNEEDPTEVEASKHDLAYIKLDGSIGCMVNGAGLAMATMDIIKLYGAEPANFLDVGGGASREKVSAAFKILLSDKNVKGVLINIFGGIMQCDVLAKGVVEAAKDVKLKVPLVVRLAGTNFKEGKNILDKSGLKILSADNLNDAAKKIVEAIK